MYHLLKPIHYESAHFHSSTPKAWYAFWPGALQKNYPLFVEMPQNGRHGSHLNITDPITRNRFLLNRNRCCHDIASNSSDSVMYWVLRARGCFKNTYEFLNLSALKFSHVNKIHIFQFMGQIFWVEFQRVPLKFNMKYLLHTLRDKIFMKHWNVNSSYN